MNAVVVWHSDDSGWNKLMNSIGVQGFLDEVAIEMVQTAKVVFEEQSHHDSQPPEFYLASFRIRRYRKLAPPGVLPPYVNGRRVSNVDRTAEWVEFGAHAGGKTRVLRYRVFGRTIDIMEARSHV